MARSYLFKIYISFYLLYSGEILVVINGAQKNGFGATSIFFTTVARMAGLEIFMELQYF